MRKGCIALSVSYTCGESGLGGNHKYVFHMNFKTQMNSVKRARRVRKRDSFEEESMPSNKMNFSYDPRVMEKDTWIIQKILAKEPESTLDEINEKTRRIIETKSHMNYEPETDAEKAQLLAYDSFGATGKKRMDLATKAIEIYPDCADAYVSLAELEHDAEKRLDLYRQGTEAGRRDLGEEIFSIEKGKFYGFLETRPFMRAYEGQGNTLWDLGREEEAVKVFEKLLELNPDDNQGNRYKLLTLYINNKNYDSALNLINLYDEDSANWLYSKAFIFLKKYGLAPQSKKALQDAFESNIYVPAIIAETVKPAKDVQYITPGEIDEATAYLLSNVEIWANEPHFLKYLLEEFVEFMKKKTGSKHI